MSPRTVAEKYRADALKRVASKESIAADNLKIEDVNMPSDLMIMKLSELYEFTEIEIGELQDNDFIRHGFTLKKPNNSLKRMKSTTYKEPGDILMSTPAVAVNQVTAKLADI